MAAPKDDIDRVILADHKLGQSALVNDLAGLQQLAKLGDDSPLGLIGLENIQSFVEDAVFSEFGLASMRSDYLEDLTVSEAYRFLRIYPCG